MSDIETVEGVLEPSFVTEGVVRSEDGQFMSAVSFATEAAYLMSTIEGAIIRNCDQFEVMDVVVRYANGGLTAMEAIDELVEMMEEGGEEQAREIVAAVVGEGTP